MAQRDGQSDTQTPRQARSLIPKRLARLEFGKRLERLMAENRMRQTDLARAAGLGWDSVSLYVRGLALPSPQSLRKLADALGVDGDVLMPKVIGSAVDSEHPALELRQLEDDPTKAWLRINQTVTFETAAKIVDLIQDDVKRSSRDTDRGSR